MYNVTPEQIDSILLVIGLSLGEQEAVFNELDFNPYDNYSDGAGDVGGILIIPKRDMENRVKTRRNILSITLAFQRQG